MANESHIFALKKALGGDAVKMAKALGKSFNMTFNDVAEFIHTEHTKFCTATKGTILEGMAGDRIFKSVMKTSCGERVGAADAYCVFVVLHIIISTGGISKEDLKQRTGDKYDIVQTILNKVFRFSDDELMNLISNEELHVPLLKNMITLKYDGMPFDVSPTGESDQW